VDERPDRAELERLGLFDPAASDAVDQLRLLSRAFELGATVDEVRRATRIFGLGPLMLDLAMRPAGETQELDAFAAGSDLDSDLVHRLWLALGLPESGSLPVRVTPDAAEALRLIAAMTTLLGEDVVLALARVVGSSVARMTEALAGAFRVGIEVPQRMTGTPYSQVVDDNTTVVRDLLPPFLEAVEAVFRRHLVVVSYQLWSTDEDRAAVTLERTVGFADLVGSTEVLHAQSVKEMAEMVRQFEEQAWDLVSRAGGRVVKLIGDEAMFVIEDPGRACDAGLGIVEASPHPVRVGLAHGPVVGLYGDYYGETVNLAARLVRAATPSTLLVSRAVRHRTGAAFTFQPVGPLVLKGFADPVPVYAVQRT
jgi:class 3 adenylate cyclase